VAEQYPAGTQYYGVRGYTTVANQSIVYHSIVASFYAVAMPNDGWLAHGFFVGYDSHGHYFLSPQLYYDYHKGYGSPVIQVDLGSVPIGTNLRCGVYTTRQFSPPWPPVGNASATWYCYNSYQPMNTYSVAGFYYAWGVPLVESESHDSLNTLNFHYTGCQYGTMGLNYYNFANPAFHWSDNPYHFTGTYTDWYSYGP